MADAPELNNPEVTPDSSGQTSQTPKTFTQDEVNKIAGEIRIRSKAQFDSQLAKAREEAAAQALEQAQMTEAEKYKLQLEQQKAELQSERDRATRAERKAALTGKVADVDAALKLLDPEHILEDGTVNTVAFLEKYPFLKTQTSQPDASAGGNGKQLTADALAAQQKENAWGNAAKTGDFVTALALEIG